MYVILNSLLLFFDQQCEIVWLLCKLRMLRT